MPRSDRPVWCGVDYGPALLVLDNPETMPAALPESWRHLGERFQIAWCPVTDDALERVEDVLETFADRRTRTHVVARATVGDAAARMISEFPEAVRTLVLVGPGRAVVHAGMRTVRVGGTDLRDPGVAREVEAAVDAVTHAALQSSTA